MGMNSQQPRPTCTLNRPNSSVFPPPDYIHGPPGPAMTRLRPTSQLWPAFLPITQPNKRPRMGPRIVMEINETDQGASGSSFPRPNSVPKSSSRSPPRTQIVYDSNSSEETMM